MVTAVVSESFILFDVCTTFCGAWYVFEPFYGFLHEFLTPEML